MPPTPKFGWALSDAAVCPPVRFFVCPMFLVQKRCVLEQWLITTEPHARSRTSRTSWPCGHLFCSLAVLNPKVDHTMDVLSPVSFVIGHSDSSTDSPVQVLMLSWPSRPCVVFLACVHLALFLTVALSLSPGNSLVSSWCDHNMLISLLW